MGFNRQSSEKKYIFKLHDQRREAIYPGEQQASSEMRLPFCQRIDCISMVCIQTRDCELIITSEQWIVSLSAGSQQHDITMMSWEYRSGA